MQHLSDAVKQISYTSGTARPSQRLLIEADVFDDMYITPARID